MMMLKQIIRVAVETGARVAQEDPGYEALGGMLSTR